MEENKVRTFLVPANTKKSRLIFGVFRLVDLIILLVGLTITFLCFMIFPNTEIWQIILILLPLIICGFLVFPFPNYHNMRTLIKEAIDFYFVNRRIYIWRGWCYKYEQSSTTENGK